MQLLNNQLQRTQLSSPLEGIIIEGDLSRSLGAPVERGQVLFEIAPLNTYRLVLLVDESDVADIAIGQQGTLVLTALPNQKLPFVIEQIATVFEQTSGQVKYRVEARVEADPQMLRPGMQGIGKIDIDRRSHFWILFHEMTDWLKLKVWLWTP